MAIGNMLTVADVAELMNISAGRVHQFVMEGRLTPDDRVGKSLLFKRVKVEKFASKDRKTGRPAEKSKNFKKRDCKP